MDLRCRECAEEDDLERDVDDRADDHRHDHRTRDVSLRVRTFACELVGLLEAEQRKDDPAGRDRSEHALRAVGAESVRGGEVAAVEVHDAEHEDRQQRNADLPPRRGAVRVGELAHAEEVDRREDRHQHDRRCDAGGRQHVLAVAQLHPAVRERVVLAVLDHRHHLDRGHRRRLQPREPAERGADRATEGVMREARRAACDGIHAAELGVGQREQEDRERADAPRDHRRGPGGRERALGAEQPAGADDRAPGCPQKADEPDLAPEARPGLSGLSLRPALGGRLYRRHESITAFSHAAIRPELPQSVGAGPAMSFRVSTSLMS